MIEDYRNCWEAKLRIFYPAMIYEESRERLTSQYGRDWDSNVNPLEKTKMVASYAGFKKDKSRSI